MAESQREFCRLPIAGFLELQTTGDSRLTDSVCLTLGRARVFFDVKTGNQKTGRIALELVSLFAFCAVVVVVVGESGS